MRDILKQYSALKYGRDRKYVEAGIGARLGISLDDSDSEDVDSTDTQADTPDANLDQTGP